MKLSVKVLRQKIQEQKKILMLKCSKKHVGDMESQFWRGQIHEINNFLALLDSQKKELREALENPNIYCNNCKDLSAENTIKEIIG